MGNREVAIAVMAQTKVAERATVTLRYGTGVFCNNCGHRNPPESNFCSSCGAPFTPSTDTTISFLPEDSLGDLADEEVSVPAGTCRTAPVSSSSNAGRTPGRVSS